MNIALLSLVVQTLVTLLASVLPVQVTTNTGERFVGELIELGAEEIRMEVSGDVQSIAIDDLVSLSPESPASQPSPVYRVELVNGSRIAAQGFSLAENELVIEPRRQSPLQVPVKQVRSIRFRAASPATDAKWLGMVQRPLRGDTLVIRRGEDRLDPQDGIVEAIVDGKVVFNLDGDQVNAPFDRLEGLIFGGNEQPGNSADIRVTDVFGSQWLAADLNWSDPEQPLTMQLRDSISHSISPAQIESIRWTGGLILLASQPIAEGQTRPFFSTKVDDGLIQKFFAPTAVGDDLIAVGGTTIEYRIDEGYQKFAGSVQRADAIDRGGRLIVRIELDSQPAWQQELTDSQPLGFDLRIGEARRLAIKIDSLKDGDLGDTVRIIRPRLVK